MHVHVCMCICIHVCIYIYRYLYLFVDIHTPQELAARASKLPFRSKGVLLNGWVEKRGEMKIPWPRFQRLQRHWLRADAACHAARPTDCQDLQNFEAAAGWLSVQWAA